MYIEDLIKDIEELNEGADIYDMIIDIILYADDILLLSNTKEGLQKMLDVTQKYGEKWEIKFNPDKTTFMVFGEKKKDKKKQPNNSDANLIFDGTIIKRVKTMKYLGVIFDESLTNNKHLETRRTMTYSAITNINKVGFNIVDLKYNVKTILYKTHIRPVLLYGLENHSINQTELKKLQITEAGIIKRSMGLTKHAKTNDLMNAMSIDLTKDRIKLIKFSFLGRLLKNDFTKNIYENINKQESNAIHKNSLIREIDKLTIVRNLDTETLKSTCTEEIKKVKKRINVEQTTVNITNIVKLLREADQIKIKDTLNPYRKN